MPRKGKIFTSGKTGDGRRVMYIIMRIICQNIDIYAEKHTQKSKQNEWKKSQNIENIS